MQGEEARRRSPAAVKLTAYIQSHGWTDFLADAIGHVAGEGPLIVAGHPEGQVGAAIAELDPLAAADHAVAAVEPDIGQGRAAGHGAREDSRVVVLHQVGGLSR